MDPPLPLRSRNSGAFSSPEIHPESGQSHFPKTTDFGALSRIRSPCLSGPMNPLPVAALPRTHSNAGSVGNAAPISTTASPTSVIGKRSRKREDSSASDQDGYEASVGDRRRQPGVKRACNECRQQKVGRPLIARRAASRADESLISYGAM